MSNCLSRSKPLRLAFVVLPILAITGCWSQFRGGAAHTGYNPYEAVLSKSNADSLGVMWKGATGGPISSSPAVAAAEINGSATLVVYVASEDGYLYAFDAIACVGHPSCAPIWSPLYLGGATHSSPALATETINGTQTAVVYVASYSGMLYAIDGAKGTQIWQAPLYGSPAYSSPAVVGDVVYVVAGDLYGAVLAINATTGTQIWQGTLATNYPSPAVSNGSVFAGDVYGYLSAFDANGCNGQYLCSPLWMGFPLEQGFSMNSSAAVANGLVVQGGNPNPIVYVGSSDGNLYAFDANGVQNCTISHGFKGCQPLWVGPTSTIYYSSSIGSSPAVAGGVVYVGADTAASANNLFAFDANGPFDGKANCTIIQGTTTWSCEPFWVGATSGQVDSSPAVANGVVYVGADNGYLYAFDAIGMSGCSGTPVVCQPLGKVKTNDAKGSSPAVSNGFIYVGSGDGYLYGIEPVCTGPFCSAVAIPPVAVE
jgi:outer membrane protein assembly factor BamB